MERNEPDARESAAPDEEDRGRRDESRETMAVESTRETAQRLRTALEDIIALAHSGGEAHQRLSAMERRAMAALSGVDRTRP